MGHLTNLHGLPDALVAAVRNDPYAGGGDISVTKLIDSPQRRALAKKYRELVVEDVSERVWALMGQAVHTVLERANTTSLVEKRLFADVGGWKLSGQFDRIHLQDGLMQDWKVCSVFKADGDIQWERQLNVLRWLAIQNGIQVDRLEVVAILRDWKLSESRRKAAYPNAAVKVIKVPAWELNDTLDYICERIKLHQRAESGDPVECSDEDRWYSGSTFALMKTGGKRAIRVAEVRAELGEPADGQEIIERPGVHRRCLDYCEVAPFCPQFEKLKPNTGQDDDVSL